ncbi:hypothetical protein ACIOEW_13705 [Streptomyces sp. NPDC087901]|uniref:hypothetical protein n=1 Tax=unclassified Streptomyces TaxID=2593676 RepID=UPI003422E2CF
MNCTYSGGTKARMVVDRKTSGSCTINGDSGGGGDSDGLFDPCRLHFTDIGLANSAFPGTVARW